MEESEVKQGKRVSLKRNPNKTGLLTGEISHMGKRIYATIQFPDGTVERELNSLQLVENETTRPTEDLLNNNFGSMPELRESITQKRLSGKLANVIYSMESTNTDYYAYQFKPVLNMLSSPCDGMLIADEVGLGKTIEAGLIWTELRQREEAARLLVVCPAVLKEKWKDELSNRFGIKADLADRSEVLDTLKRYEEQKIHDFALVTSIQGIRPRFSTPEEESTEEKVDDLSEYLRNKANSELFDLTIIDEAHYMKNPSTKNHWLGKLLRETSKWFLLLSATPIQLRSDDLYHLLSLIDEQYFPTKDSFKNYLEANEPVLEAIKILGLPDPSARDVISELKKLSRHRLFKENRQIKHLLKEVKLNSELTPDLRAKYSNQLERTNLFWHVISRTRRRDVRERTALRREVPQRITPSEPEKNIYNTISSSIRAWAEMRDISQGFILAGPQRQMSSSIPATFRYWKRKAYERQDELIESEFSEELEAGNENISEESEMKLLEFVTNKTLDLNYSYKELKSSDTKFKKLSSELLEYLKGNPEKKAIIFSTYRATVDYLVERFEEKGIKVISMKGGSKFNKQELVEDFRNEKEIRILICTEIMSEGVDLQFTNMVINYDLPWNPMKIEQRIGRVDRIGQKEDRIIIWNFLHADTIDDRIYQRLLDRIGIFENALGGLEHIIGDVLGDLTNRLLTEDLTIQEQEEVIDRGAQALENTKQLEEQVESEASSLMAHGQYILNEVTAAKDLERYVTDKDLRNYLLTFFEASYPGTHIRFLGEDKEDYSYELELSQKARIDFQDHVVKFRLKRSGIQRERKNKILFKNRTGIIKRGYEIINQFHPLIHFINHNLLKKRQDSRLAPARVRLKKGDINNGLYFFMIHRWEFTGIRDREELKYCLVNSESKEIIGTEKAERITNRALLEGEDLMSVNLSPVEKNLSKICFAEADKYLEDEFSDYRDSIERENEDRTDVQERSLRDNMEKQISSRKQAIETRKETARLKGTTANIAIEQGRIANIEARFEERLEELQKAKELVSDFEILAFGWIYCE